MISTDYRIMPVTAFVWFVDDSHDLSLTKTEKIIRSLWSFCPIFSENRFNGDIYFTVVPYKTPAYFNLAESSKDTHSREEVCRLIAQTALSSEEQISFVPESAILREKEKIPLISNRKSSILIDYLDSEHHRPGYALDLGCGAGTNALPLLRKGWQVTAIDIHAGALAKFQSQIPPHALSSAKLIENDIASTQFEENHYDLVVAMDSLPYLLPSTLMATLEKIHKALIPGGLFMGTLFFEDAKKPSSLETRMHRKCGAHYLRGDFVKSCLTHAGFHILLSKLRMDKPNEIEKCISAEFMCQKPS